MNRLPECLVVIDPKKEKNAVKEARTLGISTVALIDTDCDPDEVDLPIPGNDDGIRSVEIIARHLADAVLTGSSTGKAQNGEYQVLTGSVGKREYRPGRPLPDPPDDEPEEQRGITTD